MDTSHPIQHAMKEVVQEYYPEFFTIGTRWSKWTLENVYNYITTGSDDKLLTEYILEVESYLGGKLVIELSEARDDYAAAMELNHANQQAIESVNAFYERYVCPLVNYIPLTASEDKYMHRHRFNIESFVKGNKDSSMIRWVNAPISIRLLIRRVREFYYNVERPDVDALLQLLPQSINPGLLRIHCAGRNVEDVIKYIQCEVPDFVSVETELDKAIKAARMGTGTLYQADQHDLMGKIIVPLAVSKHKLSQAEMDVVHDRLGDFITSIMRNDINITALFRDQHSRVRDMAIDAVNAYRNMQYNALIELEKDVLLGYDDTFRDIIVQYYIPAIHDYVLGKTDICDVNEPELRDWLRQARDEKSAVSWIDSTNAAAMLRPTKHKGANKMSLNINHQHRLTIIDGTLKGSITLAIEGELAIIDVSVPHGQEHVDYTWYTYPKGWYDITVHGHALWIGDKVAISVTVAMYKNHDTVSTVTVTKDI